MSSTATRCKAVVKIAGEARSPVPLRSAVDTGFDDYLTKLSPRGDSEDSKAFRFALAISPDRRFQKFLNCLDTRRYARWSLAAIARECDLTYGEFHAFWKTAQLDRTVTKAINAGPGLVDDLAKDARSVELNCHECDGAGKVGGADGKLHVCRGCGGRGKIRQIGDRHARKMLLEIAGLTGKEQPLVQIDASCQGMDSLGMSAAAERLANIRFDLDLEAEPVLEEARGNTAPEVLPVGTGALTIPADSSGSRRVKGKVKGPPVENDSKPQ
jgi:hypothetical protein